MGRRRGLRRAVDDVRAVLATADRPPVAPSLILAAWRLDGRLEPAPGLGIAGLYNEITPLAPVRPKGSPR